MAYASAAGIALQLLQAACFSSARLIHAPVITDSLAKRVKRSHGQIQLPFIPTNVMDMLSY